MLKHCIGKNEYVAFILYLSIIYHRCSFSTLSTLHCNVVTALQCCYAGDGGDTVKRLRSIILEELQPLTLTFTSSLPNYSYYFTFSLL